MAKDLRRDVESFYTGAAEKPQPELCCPVSYEDDDVSHIPLESREISYGCGSPVALAGLKEGDVLLDLGSGGGIDCFIAAKKVGKTGRVVGVDMTDEMLGKARASAEKVAENLGYSNVEFKKGFLEEIPVEDGTVDVVTSNCVVNLSPDKGGVMSEVWRVIKDGGRFCISDIVAEGDVPEDMQRDKVLWGECISGAIREDKFLELSRGAGFYGLNITKRYLYREVKGLRFYSITLTGYKLTKGAECVYKGHWAIYNGPFSSVSDDDGHEFPSGVPVEICTDTLGKLAKEPYAGHFTIIYPDGEAGAVACEPKEGSSSCC